MPNERHPDAHLDEPVRAFYLHVLRTLTQAKAPFLVGGAYALRHYTGVDRNTKDFDIFVRREDYDSITAILNAAGCDTDLKFPHWLGKVTCERALVDVIFSSGNGISMVADAWFRHANEGLVFDIPVKLCPPEEMIWSKAFVAERERYDGADISQADTIIGVSAALGLDGAAVIEGAGSGSIKEALRTDVDAAIARGVFGSPFMIADDEPFWGFDRFEQLDAFLKNGSI